MGGMLNLTLTQRLVLTHHMIGLVDHNEKADMLRVLDKDKDARVTHSSPNRGSRYA